MGNARDDGSAHHASSRVRRYSSPTFSASARPYASSIGSTELENDSPRKSRTSGGVARTNEHEVSARHRRRTREARHQNENAPAYTMLCSPSGTGGSISLKSNAALRGCFAAASARRRDGRNESGHREPHLKQLFKVSILLQASASLGMT